MTEREKIEREIILDILAESSKWRISEDDQDEDCIRLEVMDRARRLLLGVETVDANGYAQSHPANLPAEEENLTGSDYQATDSEKLNNGHLPDPGKAAKVVNEWKSKRVRCQENGHPVWHLRSECVKEPRDNRNGGPRWTWKWIGPQDKKAQEEEAIWTEHEAGNASC